MEYEIYAVRYGRHERKAAENFIGGDPHDGPMPLDFFVWVIKGGGRTIVLDTGYDEAMAKKRSRSIIRPVGEGLKAIGVEPDSVQDVVLSHMHYDHAGNYELFPNARYHIQDTEMAYCTGRCMCHAHLRLPFELTDVTAMLGKVFAGRAKFHDGSAEIAPGISVHLIGGHSKGLQCLRVNTRRGPVVLASDASHFYANMEQGRPFTIAYDVGAVLEGYDKLYSLAASRQHVIPGHDPLVIQRYPAVKAGLEDIVRLDADPKA